MLDCEEYSEIRQRKFDLNLLTVFSLVIRTGSVSEASKRLSVGPPAVSMALARLRCAVGRDLFVRKSGRLTPTPFGLAFHARVAPSLHAIGDALAIDRDFDPLRMHGSYRIAFSDELEILLTPRILGRFRREAPGLNLFLCTASSRTASSMLDCGTADLIVLPKPIRLEPCHRSDTLYSERYVAIYDPNKLQFPDLLSIEAYSKAAHALISVGGEIADQFDTQLENLGTVRRVFVTTERFSALPPILRAAPILASVPSRLAKRFAAEFGFHWRELPLAQASYEIACAWHSRTDADPAYAWLRSIVVEEALAVPCEASDQSAPVGMEKRA